MSDAWCRMRVGDRAALVLALAVTACVASAADPGEPTLAEEAAFRAAVARVGAAVVRIEPVASAEAPGEGEAAAASGPSTGLVVASDPEASWILTTAFAVPGDVSDAVVVRADGGRQAARVAARDASRSLVLLKTQAVADLPALEPAPRRELAPGQWAIAVGRGWAQAAPSVAVGVVSAVDRAWGRAVQTDASVSPANYGGPLVDVAGRVIGILAPLPADTAGMKLGTELYDAGIGFAVPLEDMLAVLPRLQRGESLAAGVLGITWRSRDVVNGEPVIASCRQGSPAALAGLRPGDRFVRIGERPITRIGEARHQIMPRRAGDELAVEVERASAAGPRRIEARVTLAESLPPWRAAMVGVLPAAAPADAAAEGVTAAWLLPDGPAAAAGLGAGEVIRAVVLGGMAEGEGRVAVESSAALAGALAGVAPGDAVGLEVVRDGQPHAVTVTTAAALADVPPMIEGWQPAAGDPLRGPVAAAVVKLESPDEPRPPLAVIPNAGRKEPVGVLVYFGVPHGPAAEAEAVAWKAAAAAWDVAVILPGSADPQRWSGDDLPAIRRSLAALHTKRPIDPARIAVAGRAAGGGFAWFVADRLGAAVRGVAVIDSALPRTAELEPAEPGRSRWVLLGKGGDGDVARRLTEDRRRLEAAGFPVGTVAADGETPPADLLCRWNVLLGLL
jgi:serine protease Do